MMAVSETPLIEKAGVANDSHFTLHCFHFGAKNIPKFPLFKCMQCIHQDLCKHLWQVWSEKHTEHTRSVDTINIVLIGGLFETAL